MVDVVNSLYNRDAELHKRICALNVSVIPDQGGNPEIFNTDTGFPLSRERQH